jgi:hypothetical protein
VSVDPRASIVGEANLEQRSDLRDGLSQVSWPARGRGLGIGQRPRRPEERRSRHAGRFHVAGAENVQDLLAAGDEIVRDDAPMAAPPDGFGAHDRGACGVTPFAQPREAGVEFLAQSVVSVVVEAGVLPESVDRRRYAALRPAQAAKRRQMLVADLSFGERSGEHVAVELRVDP